MIEPLIKEDTDVNLALKYAIYILSSYDSPNNVGDNEKKLIIIQKLCKRTGLLTNVDQQNNNIFHAIIKKGIPTITALIIAPHLDSFQSIIYTNYSSKSAYRKYFCFIKKYK